MDLDLCRDAAAGRRESGRPSAPLDGRVVDAPARAAEVLTPLPPSESLCEEAALPDPDDTTGRIGEGVHENGAKHPLES